MNSELFRLFIILRYKSYVDISLVLYYQISSGTNGLS